MAIVTFTYYFLDVFMDSDQHGLTYGRNLSLNGTFQGRSVRRLAFVYSAFEKTPQKKSSGVRSATSLCLVETNCSRVEYAFDEESGRRAHFASVSSRLPFTITFKQFSSKKYGPIIVFADIAHTRQ